ncbi:ParA family protein [Burkholderia pyrrocinia]|uniref:ParA family protein n=1 Tax=Burkholderia pyrrocinia TaxID=60550 RepID=UPI001BCE6791|nr:ParA family protein [Burkholderia pyrrocinia]QVN18971.1 ParA family protein [Burkholderia pyrrocinia]
MKKLTIWTQKGGVGKSALTCQLAYVLRAREYRVLVIDLDSQGNASASLLRAERAVALDLSASALIMNANPAIQVPDTQFAVVKADETLSKIPEKPADFSQFAANLAANLERLSPHFDVCIIDCPPSDDMRVLLALTCSDSVLSPIHLYQESMEGVYRTLNGRRGVARVQKASNPALRFLGILPTMVEPIPIHRRNLMEVVKHFGNYLVRSEDGVPLRLLKRSAVAEAQELGVPLWELGRQKTAAREAWADTKPVFDRLAHLVMEPSEQPEQAEATRGA